MLSAASAASADLARRARTLGSPFSERMEGEFVRLETEMRTRIADAERSREPSCAAIDDAAAAENKAAAVLNALEARRRKIDGERNALSHPSRRSFWARWKPAPDRSEQLRALDEERGKITLNIIIADAKYLRAKAARTRAERERNAVVAAVASDAENQIAQATANLGIIQRARRLPVYWPAFAYCRHQSALAAAEQIEASQRLRLPPDFAATDIWGVGILPEPRRFFD